VVLLLGVVPVLPLVGVEPSLVVVGMAAPPVLSP
jgi:hypothetical protein